MGATGKTGSTVKSEVTRKAGSACAAGSSRSGKAAGGDGGTGRTGSRKAHGSGKEKSMSALADEMGVSPAAVSKMRDAGKIGWNGLKGSRCRVWMLEGEGEKPAKKKSKREAGSDLEEKTPEEIAMLLRLEKLRNLTADTELKKTRGRSFFLEMRMQMAEMVYDIFSRSFLREIREQLSTLRLSREETENWNSAMERGSSLFSQELREWAESVIKQTITGAADEEQ